MFVRVRLVLGKLAELMKQNTLKIAQKRLLEKERIRKCS